VGFSTQPAGPRSGGGGGVQLSMVEVTVDVHGKKLM